MRGNFTGKVLMSEARFDKEKKQKETFSTYVQQEGIPAPQRILTRKQYKAGETMTVLADVQSYNGHTFIQEVKPNGFKG